MKVTATEIRQRFTDILKALAAGETISVTKHGRVVAELRPVAEPPRAVENTDTATVVV